MSRCFAAIHAEICRHWETYTGIKPERVLEDGTTEPVSFTGDQP